MNQYYYDLIEFMETSSRFISMDEYNRLRTSIQDSPRLEIIIRLIGDYGMSVKEICSLRIEDIDKKKIHIEPDPPNVPYISERDIKVKDDIVDRIKNFIGDRREGYVFQTQYGTKNNSSDDFMKYTNNLIEKITGKRITERGIYRGRIADMLQNGKEMDDVSKLLGIENITVAGLEAKPDKKGKNGRDK